MQLFWARVDALPEGELDVLLEHLPRKTRAEINSKLATAATEAEQEAVLADYMLGPVTERLRLDFRAEVFNLLNHANLGLPDLVIFNANGSYRGAAGNISSTQSSSRQIQFGLKLSF